MITQDRSEAHRRVEAAHKTQWGSTNTVIERMINENNFFNTAYHFTRYKLPFHQYQPLYELQECTDGCYENNKACKIFIDYISDTGRDKVREEVGRAQWVSVMADGSTDHSITKQENVYVRYINEGSLLKTELANIVPVKSADATGIFDTIKTGLDNIGVTREMCLHKYGRGICQTGQTQWSDQEDF